MPTSVLQEMTQHYKDKYIFPNTKVGTALQESLQQQQTNEEVKWSENNDNQSKW